MASDNETGSFNSIIGIFSTLSRLVFGYLSDHSFVNRLWLYMISVTLCGISIMLNSLATNYSLMVTFCAVYGITCGRLPPSRCIPLSILKSMIMFACSQEPMSV